MTKVPHHGHLSSTAHWEAREINRQEIQARRAADPWVWADKLFEYTYQHSTPECRAMLNKWDPAPIQSHRKPSK